jgi:hypothetical protein
MNTNIIALVMFAFLLFVTMSNGIGNPSILAQTSKVNVG